MSTIRSLPTLTLNPRSPLPVVTGDSNGGYNAAADEITDFFLYSQGLVNAVVLFWVSSADLNLVVTPCLPRYHAFSGHAGSLQFRCYLTK
jgi:hypothetical protein